MSKGSQLVFIVNYLIGTVFSNADFAISNCCINSVKNEKESSEEEKTRMNLQSIYVD